VNNETTVCISYDDKNAYSIVRKMGLWQIREQLLLDFGKSIETLFLTNYCEIYKKVQCQSGSSKPKSSRRFYSDDIDRVTDFYVISCNRETASIIPCLCENKRLPF